MSLCMTVCMSMSNSIVGLGTSASASIVNGVSIVSIVGVDAGVGTCAGANVCA